MAIKYILPNFFDSYECNLTLKNNFFINQNIVGVQGTFPFCIFNGWYNNIIGESLAIYDDLVDCVKNYGILNDIVLIDFGNIYLNELDFMDSYGKVILEEYGNNKHIFFEVADEIFIQYLVEHYPNIQLVLHQNYTNMNTKDNIKNLIDRYPNNIKGIVSMNLSMDLSFTNIKKFYLLPLTHCHECHHFNTCLQKDIEATLEYSAKSQFNSCEFRQLLNSQEILDLVKLIEKNNYDYIIFDTIPITKQFEEYKIIENIFNNKQGGNL